MSGIPRLVGRAKFIVSVPSPDASKGNGPQHMRTLRDWRNNTWPISGIIFGRDQASEDHLSECKFSELYSY